MNTVPIEVDESEQERATGVIVDRSLGSATAAGDELRVPPAAMAAGDRLVFHRFRACRVPFRQSCPRFYFCLFWHLFFSHHVDVLGTFPFPLRFPFVVRKDAYVAYISSTPNTGI